MVKKRNKETAAGIKKRRPGTLALTRLEKNPVIAPRPENDWESWQTFNPGVILLENEVHFLYRAIGSDGISRFGYAVSGDGFTIDERLPYPAYEHALSRSCFNVFSFASGGSFGGCEDPRLVRVDQEDKIYMTYTACDEGLRVALTSIKVDDFLQKRWRWSPPKLISPPGEVHKNWVIFPERINGKYAILTSISPEISIAYRDSLKFREEEYIASYYNGVCGRKDSWDTYVRGAGPPPLKTKYGWLLFYHAIDERDPGKYKVGTMLLDLDNPAKILHRLKEPMLEPEEKYENDGFKTGIVYASGAVIKDGRILIYYGGADSFVNVAYADLDRFLGELAKEIKPGLEQKTLKKKK
jgi:predicted GH43/DUF377 family glycosyl hydrolase